MKEQNLYPLPMQLCGDVPSQVRIRGKFWPIGRYLKNKLRKEVGIDEQQVKEFNRLLLQQATKEKLQEVETASEFQTEVLRLKKSLSKKFITSDDYKKGLMELYNRTRIDRSEKLSKIYQKERMLDNDAASQKIQAQPEQ